MHKENLMARWFVLAASLFVVTAFGCGFGDPEPTRVPATAVPDIPQGATLVEADIKNFTHPDLDLKANTVVVWTNQDQPLHTIAHISGDGTPSLFNSGGIAPDASFRFHFTEPGEYTYQCLIHPVNMKGVVTVTE
jgi:plastocyanin